MPRFNAAKSWKKLDDDLSGKFNYLCDLLDEGYSSVALINNHEIAIDINPKDGIKIVNDGSSIFSLDPLTGEIVIGKYDGLISDKANTDDLGDLAYDDLVELAKLGSTIISGGYIKTELIQIGEDAAFEEGYDPTEKVEIDTTYKGVKINETDGFVSTATIGGKTATVKLNSVDGLAFYDGATYRGGLGVRDSQLSLLTDVLGTASDPNHFLKFATYQPWEGPFPDEKGTRLEFHNKGYMSSTIYKSAQMESFGYPWGGVFHIVAPGDSPHMALWVGERSPYGEDFTTHLILDKDNNANNAMFSLNAASADFYNSTTITGISTHDPNSEGYIAFHVDGTLVGSMEADRLWMLQEIEIDYSASNINNPSILLKRSGHDDWKIHMGYGDFNISSNTTGSTYSTFHVAHNAAVGIGMRPNENYAGSLSLTGRIIGSTSNTWITARRIGLGVAANSNYTVDAGSGYIRGGRFYSGSSAGQTRTLRVKNTLGQDVNANFTGGILTSVTSP